MLDGPAVVAALRREGVSHVVWLPDSELGKWEPALTGPAGLPLIRACREGEAIGIAAGLLLGGKRPIVVVQCTGLFEAGDALRNVLHDLGLPLFLLVGVRSWKAAQGGGTRDNCPRFTPRILDAWALPYRWLDESRGAADLTDAYQSARESGR